MFRLAVSEFIHSVAVKPSITTKTQHADSEADTRYKDESDGFYFYL